MENGVVRLLVCYKILFNRKYDQYRCGSMLFSTHKRNFESLVSLINFWNTCINHSVIPGIPVAEMSDKMISRTETWWRHQMEPFSALLAIFAVNSPVPGEFPTQRPVTRSCDVFFDLRMNKRLSKQSWGWWFETLSCPLWRQCNEVGQKESLPVRVAWD